MKIYVIDDSMMIWAWLRDIATDIEDLLIAGFSAKSNGAVERILELRPDLVILDLRLPGGSGIQLLKQIKEATPDTPVAVFTSYMLDSYKTQCLELGADYMFDKSRDHEKLVKLLSDGSV